MKPNMTWVAWLTGLLFALGVLWIWLHWRKGNYTWFTKLVVAGSLVAAVAGYSLETRKIV